MMRKSSFRPVPRLIDCEGGTSSVRLSPSGVHSKIHATIMATGKPSRSEITTNRTAQFGMSKNGKTCVAIWIKSQATTP